jgi:hypothetical protein
LQNELKSKEEILEEKDKKIDRMENLLLEKN